MVVSNASRIPPGFPTGQVAEICRKWSIARLELFGSRARGDHREDSDYDFLYTIQDPLNFGLHEYMGLHNDLEALLGRPVQAISRETIETSKNPYRRKNVLRDAIDVYES